MLRISQSFCPLDCPDACSLEVETNHGRVVRIDGDHRNPVTQGFICSKVRHLPRHLYGENRLLHPQVRDGAKGEGRFRRVSWDEALDHVAQRLRKVVQHHGGEAILPLSYGGSNGLLSQDTSDARLFRRLGASRLGRTVCAAPSSRAVLGLYGRVPGVAPQDYAHSKLIVIWGSNPSVSGIHQVPYIRQALAQGGQLVVVDPRQIPLARQADLHLPLRPGTDLVVALAVVRQLFETGRADLEFLAQHATGVDELRRRAQPWTLQRAAAEAGIEAEQIARLTDLWAAASPAIVRCGYGVERNRNGGSAIAAILSLPAVAGKFGVRGGGYTMSNAAAFDLDTEAAVAAPPVATRLINMNQTGRALLGENPYQAGPPVQALVIYNHNPSMTLPDQGRVQRGLAREDLFTVVVDPVRTDTSRWADVLLPATTMLEHAELQRGYGTMILQQAEAVATPPGEARSNHEIFLDLLRRLDLELAGDPVDLDAFRRAALDTSGRGRELAKELAGEATAFPRAGKTPRLFRDFQPATSDGKIQLCPADLDTEPREGLYHYAPNPAAQRHPRRYPLALISPATQYTISSSFGQLVTRRATLEMNPEDAAQRSLAEGSAVRVFNELGEVRCALKVTTRQRPGVVFLPKGLWSHATENGATANALVPDHLTDFAGGACFNDARVEVEAADSD